MTWDKGHQLVGMVGNGKTISYKYDAQGRRISKTVNGVTTTFTYSGGLLMRQSGGPASFDFQYDAGGNLIGFKHNGTPYYYLRNLQGDVTGVLDTNDTIVAKYVYNAWGSGYTSYAVGGAIHNPIRYRGYYCDAETGFYFLNSRYYDPEVKRFINADSTFVAGNALTASNMYAYCNGNPVMGSDPSGMAYEATMTWASTMWWLTLVDGPIPVGDIIYGLGVAGIAIFDTISMVGTNDAVISMIALGPDVITNAVDNLSNWYQKTISSSAPGPGDPNWKGGFKSFSKLKKYLGSPGKGNQWHHIVEQNQIKKSGFSTYNVNNINNVMPLSKDVHKAVSAYYSSKPRGAVFGDLTVRDWLAGQSFEAQYKFGLEIIDKAQRGLL